MVWEALTNVEESSLFEDMEKARLYLSKWQVCHPQARSNIFAAMAFRQGMIVA